MRHRGGSVQRGQQDHWRLQLANGAIYTDDTCSAFAEIHDAKLQALEDVIEEVPGMSVLVAYHFKSDLARLQRAFPKGRAPGQRPADHPRLERREDPGLVRLTRLAPATA